VRALCPLLVNENALMPSDASQAVDEVLVLKVLSPTCNEEGDPEGVTYSWVPSCGAVPGVQS
jgi:hypothetical protein